MLIHNLMFQVRQIDAKAGFTDPVSGPVMKQLIDTIRSFGLSFHVWRKPPILVLAGHLLEETTEKSF